jgi:hypothetical protein
VKCVGISTTLFHSGFHYTSVVVRCTNCEVSGEFFFFFAEFIYPSSWVGDQTLLYREAKKAESQRSLDPPPLTNGRLSRPRNISEPVAAFGPPGSNGELNVSVIVSPVPQDFS